MNKSVNFNITMADLEDIILFITSENMLIRRQHIVKIKKLMSLIDIKDYENDREMEVRIYFINKYIEGILDKGISEIYKLVEYAKGFGEFSEDIDEIVEDIENTPEFSDEDVVYIDDKITTMLNYEFVFRMQPQLDNFSMRLKAQDYTNLNDFLQDYKECIKDLNNQFNENEGIDKESGLDFNSNDIDTLENTVNHTVQLINRPNHKIRSSVRFLNTMLNGGYEAGRFYLFLGLPGGWKSGQLLNICLDVKNYNKDFKTQDPTKKPAILYVTQENSIPETLGRIWSHYFGETREMEGLSSSQIMQELNKVGFDEGPALFIKYRKSKGIDTDDIDVMIDNLRDDGYECVMVVHDYMKRIKSTERHREAYEELGAVADEFCNIAKMRSIPVISASQLNREAFRVVENAMSGNNTNIMKKIGSSHVGESVRMIDNSDVVIAIGKEVHPVTEKEFLTYKRLKFRGNIGGDSSNLNYFAHPYENGMKLVPDVDKAKSVSILDMGDGLNEFNPSKIKRNQGTTSTPVKGGKTTPKPTKNVDEIQDFLKNEISF